MLISKHLLYTVSIRDVTFCTWNQWESCWLVTWLFTNLWFSELLLNSTENDEISRQKKRGVSKWAHEICMVALSLASPKPRKKLKIECVKDRPSQALGRLLNSVLFSFFFLYFLKDFLLCIWCSACRYTSTTEEGTRYFYRWLWATI